MNDEMVHALNSLSTFYGENTLANRRNMRGQLETQCLDVHRQFLADYSKIQEVIQNSSPTQF